MNKTQPRPPLRSVNTISEGLKTPIILRNQFNARNDSQADLYRTIKQSKVTLATGPAGTGKTLVPIAEGAEGLKSGKYDRLVLARPAVSAGESIGFLPGDADDKLAPYMAPIYDSLNYFFRPELIADLRANGMIEIVPIAFMRGRTLNNAFIMADEMQNSTVSQAKMVFTRIGQRSTMVISGDPTQCDLSLKPNELDGLSYLLRGLEGTPGLGIHRSTNDDVVREDIVMHGLNALDAFDARLKLEL